MSFDLFDFTHPDPAWNVAIDEAFVESRDETGGNSLLRVWEPNRPMVVVGRSSKHASEVKLDACRKDSIAVIRRCSGGASIVTAPGCLMYAVVLAYEQFPELRILDEAHRFVMHRLQSALDSIGIQADFRGTCDLVVDEKKFSGNAVRVTRDWLLYHGTILCSMDLLLIEKYLGTPDPSTRISEPTQPFRFRDATGHLHIQAQVGFD